MCWLHTVWFKRPRVRPRLELMAMEDVHRGGRMQALLQLHPHGSTRP